MMDGAYIVLAIYGTGYLAAAIVAGYILYRVGKWTYKKFK